MRILIVDGPGSQPESYARVLDTTYAKSLDLSAVSAQEAVTTSCPRRTRMRLHVSTMSASSSTTRMRPG